MNPMLAITLINVGLIALAVALHYEFMYQISVLVPRLITRHRPRILAGVFAALVAHSVEIWLFGLGYYLAHYHESLGQLQGNFDGSLLDAAYFSFTTFTTLGFGDIEPTGPLRYTVGLEALTGLVLITWTASFLFVEMQRYWNDR
jgi:hypothetical protein